MRLLRGTFGSQEGAAKPQTHDLATDAEAVRLSQIPTSAARRFMFELRCLLLVNRSITADVAID